ncbi:MAG TPA: hypothetical protein PLY68_04415 [Myxococcota bacterium]|nr:hypothetical protein [Myxococcota bacterium]HNZ04129.1 hypothetical protein [Myxococcota bacterium]HOD08021.1 hypothetical protein [Myxococcota bacterium]HPB50340.1 hypothetical protein [Myxococcota bacterium]HQP95422.1 hypothetical protein [Myxococcota bacterium]
MEAELKRRRPPRVQQAPSPTGPLEELNRLCDLVTRGDYFECLGLSREVGTSGVREAWIRTSAELMDLRVRTAGFEGAAASIDMVERVCADAFEVLSDPDLRLAYLRAGD